MPKLAFQYEDEALQRLGANILFDLKAVYGTEAVPETAAITCDVTGAKLGIIQLLIHKSTTEPTYDAKIVKKGTYSTTANNYMYLEYISPTRIHLTIW